MAADVLKVDPQQLVSTASKFKSEMQNMQVAHLKMSEAIRSLDGTWDGGASEQFKSNFDAMYNNLKLTDEKMTDAVEELLKANELFEQYEQQNQQLAASLDEGTSPFA